MFKHFAPIILGDLYQFIVKQRGVNLPEEKVG